ncbi:50S ribosomal protein L32e [Candidatus Woesearchaeota archaeon]|nr:50S ribosomal protein L32e [Candidatus Woesearchaeota archaeon]
MNQTLLELRNKIKDKKPDFIRQDNPKRMKLNYKWRKPKGIHSKIRHHFKGRRKMPSPGYKSPIEVRGLHSSGLKIVRVFSLGGISKIKNGAEGMVISRSVGSKKRLELLKKAKELNITILNLNVDEHIKRIEHMISLKKSKTSKEAKKDSKEKPKEEAKEKKEEKQDASGEAKKEAEKKEKDRLLTKRV